MHTYSHTQMSASLEINGLDQCQYAVVILYCNFVRCYN
jgi:hypothetical protein